MESLRSPRRTKPKNAPVDPARAKRLDELEKKIRVYEPEFDFDELKAALVWAGNTPRKKRPTEADDHFPDELLTVEELVRVAKADRETLLVAALYRCVKPEASKPPNLLVLKTIETTFPPEQDKFPARKIKGRMLRTLMEDTLSYRALNMPDLYIDRASDERSKSIKKQEFLSLFKLVSLWAGRKRRAILLGCFFNFVNLRAAVKDTKRNIFSDNVIQRLAINAEYVHAPLAKIAGHPVLESNLLNLVFRLKYPERFQEISTLINQVTFKDDADKIQKLIIDRLEERFARQGWKAGIHFDVSYRRKSEESVYRKLTKKNKGRSEDQSLEATDLADIYGVRVVVLPPAGGYAETTNIRRLSPDERLALTEELERLPSELYEILAASFGRANKAKTHERYNPETGEWERYSHIQERIEELAVAEPRAKDPERLADPIRTAKEAAMYPSIKDACFDNYWLLPKKSGVRFYKDRFFFPTEKLRGERYKDTDRKPVEVEVQIITAPELEEFLFGHVKGHLYYKEPGLREHASAIDHWLDMADAEMNGERYEGPEHVYVFGPHNELYDISENPTVAGFLAAANQVGSPTITIKDPFSSFDAPIPTDQVMGLRLINGCRVIPSIKRAL